MTEVGSNSNIDVTAASFRQDVIAQSAKQPVIVEFWAPDNADALQFMPQVAKVILKTQGRVRHVKLNIDAFPDIAGQLGVQALPAVIAFQKGQPIDGFNGALPESQIRFFLERLIGPFGDDNDDLVSEAAQALAEGDAARAAEIFSQVLSGDETHEDAIAGLVRASTMLGELDRARTALAAAPQGRAAHSGIAAARAALENAEQAAALGDVGALETQLARDPKNDQLRFDFAIGMNARGEREKAADALLEIIRRNRSWNDEAARKQLLQFFEEWGFMDPETLSARRKLSGLLFS